MTSTQPTQPAISSVPAPTTLPQQPAITSVPASTALPTQPTISSIPAPTAGATSTSPRVTAPPAYGHLLVAITGDVQLAFTPEGSFFPASAGVVIEPDTIFKLGPGASAVVLCDSLDPQEIPEGMSTTGLCSAPTNRFILRDGLLVSPARGAPAQAPFLIAPRATYIMAPPPELRWNDTHAPPYAVDLRDTEQAKIVFSATDVQTNMVPLSAEIELRPGATYLVTVIDQRSQFSGSEGIFVLLTEEEARQQRTDIDTATNNLARFQLPDAAITLAQAQLHIARGLYADAITLLEPLTARNPSPIAFALLGECYRFTSRYDLAGPAYEQARAALTNQDELLLRGMIAFGAGETALQQNQSDQARMSLDEAREIYTHLKQDARVSTIDNLIKNIP